MDIVSRLKKFISYANVPVTQFADNCNIARPTLSQLLNGRNKKVSDELISKIHDAYPSLSVLWLMFGEGDMLTTKNNEISQGQNPSIFDFDSTQTIENEETTTSISFEKNISENSANIFSEENDAKLVRNEDNLSTKATHSADNNTGDSSTISFNADQNKKIVNIIVYYNDNSFESFVPNK